MAGAHSAARVSAEGGRSELLRLLDIIADIFQMRREQLSTATSADDIPEWDSLRTIYLATAIEAEFGMTFEPEEIADIQSVQAITEMLAAKGVWKAPGS